MGSINPLVAQELPFLIALAGSSEKGASLLLRKATTVQLWALRDAAKELLDFKIQLTVLQREALQPFVDAIRALGYATSLSSIKDALRIHFSGRLLLLQGLVIPVIEQIEGTIENPNQRDNKTE